MPLHFVRDDITRVKADMIVNAANDRLEMGGGVCGAIFRAAGPQKLTAACQAIGGCPTGQAVVTPGFALSKYIVHAVGPVWQDGMHGERTLLEGCYRAALELAVRHEAQSIAFPLISAGIYGYPREEAMTVAVQTIRRFLHEIDDEPEVLLVLFDRAAYTLGSDLWGTICNHLDENDPSLLHAAAEKRVRQATANLSYDAAPVFSAKEIPYSEAEVEAEALPYAPVPTARRFADEDDAVSHIAGWLKKLRPEESFSAALLRLIDERGEKDSAIYKRANIDRRLFSKIRSVKGYQPSKNTVLALCLALHLDRTGADMLLKKAGYALTDANRRDQVIIICLNERFYDVDTINTVLWNEDLPQLGA